MIFNRINFTFAVATLLLMGTSRTQAQTGPTQSPQSSAVHISLSLDSRLVLGEPIILRYALSADAKNPRLPLFPFEQKNAWLHVELRNADGKVVSQTDLNSVRGADAQARQTRFNKEQRREFFPIIAARTFKDYIVLGRTTLVCARTGNLSSGCRSDFLMVGSSGFV